MFNIIDDNIRKDPLALATQKLFVIILSSIDLYTPCVTFDLCTLTSGLFQRELLILSHLQQRQNQVHPIVNRLVRQ